MVLEHIKLLEMTWDDTRKLIVERLEMLKKLDRLIKAYDQTLALTESVLEHAENTLSAAEASHRLSSEDVKVYLTKLQVRAADCLA